MTIISSMSILVPVKKHEHLTTTYTNTLKSTLERRRHLSQTKIFDCDCKRCADPKELGTYGSSLVCGRCQGLILSENPLDNASQWRCEKCKSQLGQEVKKGQTTVNRVRRFNLFYSGFPNASKKLFDELVCFQ